MAAKKILIVEDDKFLASASVVAGIAAGMLIMYITSILV